MHTFLCREQEPQLSPPSFCLHHLNILQWASLQGVKLKCQRKFCFQLQQIGLFDRLQKTIKTGLLISTLTYIWKPVDWPLWLICCWSGQPIKKQNVKPSACKTIEMESTIWKEALHVVSYRRRTRWQLLWCISCENKGGLLLASELL